jgi:hypothetical protein
MPEGEDIDGIMVGFKAVERDIAGFAEADQQFP